MLQTLRVGWEQLLTAVARNINEVENQVSVWVIYSSVLSLCPCRKATHRFTPASDFAAHKFSIIVKSQEYLKESLV
jgi:hypothetical protein